MKKRTSIREVEGDVTTDRLDVTHASAHLDAAEAALERSDWVAAGTALAAVNNDVVRTRAMGDLPLMKARENLELARARFQEGKEKAAVMPLRSAAEALATVQVAGSTERPAELDAMRAQIEVAAREASHGHRLAAGQIDRPGWRQSCLSDSWCDNADLCLGC